MHGSCGLADHFKMVFQAVGIEFADDLTAVFVVADGRERQTVEAKLADVVGEVGGGTAEFLSVGEAVEKRLTESDDIIVFFHG